MKDGIVELFEESSSCFGSAVVSRSFWFFPVFCERWPGRREAESKHTATINSPTSRGVLPVPLARCSSPRHLETVPRYCDSAGDGTNEDIECWRRFPPTGSPRLGVGAMAALLGSAVVIASLTCSVISRDAFVFGNPLASPFRRSMFVFSCLLPRTDR
jgi:hypothetical protein